MPQSVPRTRRRRQKSLVYSCISALLLLASLVASAAQAPDAKTTSSAAVPEARWSRLAATLFQNKNSEHGLPNIMVTALAEDGDGFIWVGTQGGLARWDGYRFQPYRQDAQKTGALPANYIRTLYTDRASRLWIGTVNGGLARYDRNLDQFITYPVGPAGTSHVSITAIREDDAGRILVGTDGGLDQINASTGAVNHFRNDAKDPHSLPANRIQSLLSDRNGTWWVGTQKGLVRRAASVTGNGGFISVALPLASGLKPVITTLLQSRDGRIWIGTKQYGVFVLDSKTGNVQALHETGDAASPLASEWIDTLVETTGGDVWVGTFGHGVVIVDTKTMQTRRIHHDPSLPSSLASDSVLTSLRDRAGLIWIGGEKGVGHHDPQQTAVSTFFASADRSGESSDGDVLAVLATSDGHVWLGLNRNGIDIVDPIAGRAGSLRPDPASRGSGVSQSRLEKAPVIAFAEAANRTLYIATGGGLFSADPANRVLQRWTLPSRNPVERIGALLLDGERLYAGGGNDGVWMADLKNGNAPFTVNPLVSDKLTDQRVTALERGVDGAVWIGTRNGLNRFQPASQQVEKILPDATDPLKLSSGFISSLLTDRSGQLWVGTNGGVNVLVARDAKGLPRFRRIGVKDGLPDANAAKMLEDTDGKIWVSTDAGIAVIDPKNFSVRALGRADGVAIPGFWNNSGAVTAQGEILFGGGGGLTILRPSAYKEWRYRPPVVVTDARLGGKPVAAYRFNGAADANGAPLVVKPEANSLAIEFAALDYSSPEHNRYAYRLDGYDKAWIDTDASRRLAAYTNLPPGDYRLRMRGSNRNGTWTEQELIVPVRVMSAWYQTIWMRCIEALAAIAAMYGLVHVRTRYLRRRHRELENQVGERTAQLQDKQLELLAANNELNNANADLALSAETLRQLSDVGRDITANLDATAVFHALDRHVHGLLDATHLSIMLIADDGASLRRVFGIEHGKHLPVIEIGFSESANDAIRCLTERREIFIDSCDSDMPVTTDMPPAQSRLFLPLTIRNQVLGVITIQSVRRHAYAEREKLIFRSLCAYGAIALDNATAYRQVEATLKRLRETQAQLVQQEKMASLGILTAGVAHEINNPANFAHVGAQGMSEDLERFRTFLLSLAADDTDTTIIDHLNRRIDALSNQTDTIVEGTTRIKNLVLDLLAFAHRDQPVKMPAPIIDNLVSTVNLVRSRYADTTEIRCDLPFRPTIECWPALLNQVFMNVIVNACQATINVASHGGQDAFGALTIRSRCEDEKWLAIDFEDNGCGIKADVIDHIFEPFFSTREVGSGTGMGLSTSFGIMEKHGGKILVRSTEGAGTCITVMLPLS